MSFLLGFDDFDELPHYVPAVPAALTSRFPAEDVSLRSRTGTRPSKPPGCGIRSARDTVAYRRPRLQHAHEGRRFASESSPPSAIGTMWSISVAIAPQWTQFRP